VTQQCVAEHSLSNTELDITEAKKEGGWSEPLPGYAPVKELFKWKSKGNLTKVTTLEAHSSVEHNLSSTELDITIHKVVPKPTIINSVQIYPFEKKRMQHKISYFKQSAA